MFKKFNIKEDVSGSSLVKSSVQRGIRQKVLDQYEPLQSIADDILPKKSSMYLMKCHEHVNLVLLNNRILFFNQREGSYAPTLRLVHEYPGFIPVVQVDRGAIKFLLSGANIMCPGLTSPGARMDVELPEGAIVAVMAEGKEHALAIGRMKMSTTDIKKINKGIGVETLHYLGDGLWKTRMDA
ncbi:PUA-like domain-containing protein [Syncephalis fuscata]|nr:PUA-like domain-containing protein [Syncephalis fuscata]